jgi:hypothetical protein
MKMEFSYESNLRELEEGNSVGVTILQIVGNFFALIFFISPLFQIISMKLYSERHDIKNVPLFLILTIIFNCLFWLLNAFSSGDLKSWIPLLVSNIGGLIINTFLLFFYLFVLLKRKVKRFLFFGFFVVNLLVEVTYLTFRYVINPSKEKKDNDTFYLIGFVATIINVLMYSSPVQNIKVIIKEGRYEALPIYTLISGFFVTLTFFIQGILSFTQIKSSDDNKNVKRRSAIETMISNGLSFFLLACLAGVYAYFYFKPPIPQKINIDVLNKGNIDEGLNDKNDDVV